MMTTTLAKELIRECLEKKETYYGWGMENADDAFKCNMKAIGFLPRACNFHRENVYNHGINVNTIHINHFNEDDCLFYATGRIARRVYLVVETNEEDAAHKGKIYVTICNVHHEGNGEISCNDWGEKDYTLEELEQNCPEFLMNLVFHLK